MTLRSVEFRVFDVKGSELVLLLLQTGLLQLTVRCTPTLSD